MNLSGTQLKDTYGNLLTTGTTAGSPTSGGLQNGDGTLLTSVGIGTNSPSHILDIESANSPQLRITDTTNDVAFKVYAQDADVFMGTHSNHALRIATNNDEKLRIEADGDIAFYDDANNQGLFWDASTARLGIGTTSPDATLELAEASIVNLKLNRGGTLRGEINVGSGLGSVGVQDFVLNSPSNNIHLLTNTLPRVTILNNGNVGIGTQTPFGNLHIQDTVNTAWSSSLRATNWITTENTSTTSGSYSGIEMLAKGTGNTGAVNLVCVDSGSGSADFVISTRNNGTYSEKMRIDSSGNVGIGTTSPAFTSGSGVEIEKASGATLRLQHTGTNANASEVRSVDGALEIYQNNAFPIKFGTSATERMRILSSGGITFNGDTATANALDDYEEGTHQATVTCTTSGTITLDSGMDLLSYTKIGRLMTVTGQLQVSSVSSPTGRFSVSLPTSIADLSERAGRSSGSIFVSNTSTNADNFFINGIEGQNSFTVYKGGSTNGTDDSADTFDGDEFITLSFTYVSA